METIQVVLDLALLCASDEVATRARMSRSGRVREALREHLKRLQTRELEARDRRGYQEHPDASSGLAHWERVAAWPDR